MIHIVYWTYFRLSHPHKAGRSGEGRGRKRKSEWRPGRERFGRASARGRSLLRSFSRIRMWAWSTSSWPKGGCAFENRAGGREREREINERFTRVSKDEYNRGEAKQVWDRNRNSFVFLPVFAAGNSSSFSFIVREGYVICSSNGVPQSFDELCNNWNLWFDDARRNKSCTKL